MGRLPAAHITWEVLEELRALLKLVQNAPELLARFGKLSGYGSTGRIIVGNAYQFAAHGTLLDSVHYGIETTKVSPLEQVYLILAEDISEDLKRRLNELFGDAFEEKQRRELLQFFLTDGRDVQELYELLDLLPNAPKQLQRHGMLTAVGHQSQICMDIAYRLASQGMRGEDFPELETYTSDGLFLVMKLSTILLADAIKKATQALPV
jgi:hypothetical protein